VNVAIIEDQRKFRDAVATLNRWHRRLSFELHNNFTAKGAKKTDDGTLPTIMRGTKRSRSRTASTIGSKLVSIFSPARSTATVLDFVGSHIRPRFRVPPKFEVAGGRQSVARDLTGALPILRRSVELGDSSHHR